jgi:hypothetical protein
MSGSHANRPHLLSITGMLGIGGIHSEGLFADMGFDFGGFGFFNRLFRRRAGPRAGPTSGCTCSCRLQPPPPAERRSSPLRVRGSAHGVAAATWAPLLTGEKLTVRIPQPAPSSAWSENCSTSEHLAQSNLGAHGLRHNAVAHSDTAAAISRVISAN